LIKNGLSGINEGTYHIEDSISRVKLLLICHKIKSPFGWQGLISH
jgi:hypothetical protein